MCKRDTENTNIRVVLGPELTVMEQPSQPAVSNLRFRTSAAGDEEPQDAATFVVDGSSVMLHERNYLDVANENAPQRGGHIFNRDDWLMMPKEPLLPYIKRLFTEGHTVSDACMTCACAQVGQIMLNSPNALYKMGLVSGGISMAVFLACGCWTMYQFIALYMELRRFKMLEGSWWETDGKHRKVLQIFEVFGHFLGLWAKVVTVAVLVVIMLGLLMTQINASSNNMYFVDRSRTKREWSLIYGGIMCFTMILFPHFNHFRMANVVGLVTVLCMSVFMVVTAAQRGFQASLVKRWALSSQDYFTGASIWLSILGTHAVTFETLESMEQPKHFKTSFSSAWVWTILVTVPSSMLFNFSYPDFLGFLQAQNALAYADNAFSLLGNTAKGIPGTDAVLTPPKFGVVWDLQFCPPPVSTTKYAMAIMMNMHQFIAFALYGTSLAFVWEKVLGVHTKPWYIRIPCRIPIGALIYFLAILAPFYGAINSLVAAVAVPILCFVLPSLCLLVHFKSRAQIHDSVLRPYSWVMWTPAWLSSRLEAASPRLALVFTPWFFFNSFMLTIFSGFGGASIYYSVRLVQTSFATFGAFPECYACLPPTKCPLSAPAPAV